MPRTVVFFALLALVAMLFWTRPASAEDVKQRVLSAARDGLPGFLAKIPAGDLAAYGFPDGADPAGLTLGEPLLLHAIAPEALEAYEPGQGVGQLLTPTSTWYVPVESGGEPRAFLAVEEGSDGSLAAVSLGYAKLAGRYAEALAGPARPVAGRPTLAASFQGQEYFLADPAGRPDRLYSLRGDQTKSAAANDPGFGLSNVVNRLLPVVRENVRSGGGR